MRILVAAPFGPAGLGDSSATALTRLGHTVERFDYRRADALEPRWQRWLRRRSNHYLSFMNNLLLQRVQFFKPDLLFVVKGETIFPETLESVRTRFNVRSAVWHADNPLNVLNSSVSLVYSIPVYDHVFVFDPYYIPEMKQISGRAVHYLPLCSGMEPADPSAMTSAEHERFKATVAFVGNAAYYRSQRRDLLNHIADLDLKIWGHFWKRESTAGSQAQGYWGETLTPALEQACQGSLAAPDLYKAYAASKIGFNALFEQSIEAPNVRTFEIPASGTLMLTNSVRLLDQYFKPGEEMVVYSDADDLRKKALYYRDHENERSAIAQRGRERFQKEHTARHRMQAMLATIFP